MVVISSPHTVLASEGALVVGARLDVEEGAACRLVFSGSVHMLLTDSDADRLRLYRWKERAGSVVSVVRARARLCEELLVAGLYCKGGPVGLVVRSESGYVGRVGRRRGTAFTG